MTDQQPGQNSEERRRFPRFIIDIPIKFKIPAAGGLSTYCFGRGTDIGEGGFMIHVAHELVIGKSMEITLTLPNSSRSISCRVVVRNRNSFRYGVEIREMDARDRELLFDTCRKLGVMQSL